MANGALASAAGIEMPDLAKNPAAVDLSGMAGNMKQATTYKPNDDAMVSGQLGKLLSKDSDYMTRARTSAMQASAKRGLLNSSIAGGAGEAAAIDAALPIARDDAASNFRSQQDNAGALNTFDRDANAFGRQGALDKYKGALSMASQGLDIAAADKDRDLRRDTASADNTFRNSDLSFRRDTASADNTFRNSDLSFRRDAASADNTFRNSDLSFRRDAAGADIAVRNSDLDLRRSANANDVAMRTKELGLREQDLTQTNQFRKDQLAQTAGENKLTREADVVKSDRQARSQLSNDIRQLRQQASQSQAALEADPNMSADAKRTAIINLANKGKADIIEMVKFSGLNMPDAWPDDVHLIGVTPAAEPGKDAGGKAAEVGAAPGAEITYSQSDDWVRRYGGAGF